MFHKKKYQSFETKLTQAKPIEIETEGPKKKEETNRQLKFIKRNTQSFETKLTQDSHRIEVERPKKRKNETLVTFRKEKRK